jgi:hypothetical protein
VDPVTAALSQPGSRAPSLAAPLGECIKCGGPVIRDGGVEVSPGRYKCVRCWRLKAMRAPTKRK